MADEHNADGELIPRGTPPTPVPARTAKHRTIDRLLSMLSIWPFRNKAFARSLETAQEVLEKQTKLEETMIGHGRTRGRLNDLEITLAQDRLERRRTLIEERSRGTTALNNFMLEGEMMDQTNRLKKGEVRMQQEEQEIQQLEQKKRKLQAKKELEELSKPPPPPPPPPAPPPLVGRGRTEKQKLRERAYKRHDRDVARIDAMSVTAQRKTALKRAATNDLEEEIEKIERTP